MYLSQLHSSGVEHCPSVHEASIPSTTRSFQSTSVVLMMITVILVEMFSPPPIVNSLGHAKFCHWAPSHSQDSSNC